MERRTLREKQLHCMGKDVAMWKDIMKKWYHHAGIRFLKEHELTDEQEILLEEFTDFITESLDNIAEDDKILRQVVLPPVKLPQKKVKS